jgi:hypothetical protein
MRTRLAATLTTAVAVCAAPSGGGPGYSALAYSQVRVTGNATGRIPSGPSTYLPAPCWVEPRFTGGGSYHAGDPQPSATGDADDYWWWFASQHPGLYGVLDPIPGLDRAVNTVFKSKQGSAGWWWVPAWVSGGVNGSACATGLVQMLNFSDRYLEFEAPQHGGGDTPGHQIDGNILADLARAELVLPTFRVFTNPAAGTPSDVNLPVWAWVAYNGARSPADTATVPTPGGALWAGVATSQPEISLSVSSPGQAQVYSRCGATGSHYTGNAIATPPCGVTFLAPSTRYTITVTARWTVWWTASDSPGRHGFASPPWPVPVRTGTSAMIVREVQSASSAPAPAAAWPRHVAPQRSRPERTAPRSASPAWPFELAAAGLLAAGVMAALRRRRRKQSRRRPYRRQAVSPQPDAAWAELALRLGEDEAAARVEVTLLGPVSVTAPGEIEPDGLALATELVAYLATHPGGVHPNVLTAAIWPRGVTEDVRDAVLARVQAWLGSDGIGRPHLAADASGRLRLGSGVRVDWQVFRTLISQAEQAAGSAREQAKLAKALSLVTGPFLAGTERGRYAWVVTDGLEYEIAAWVGDAAHRLCALRLAGADPLGAMEAARAGLRIVPDDELLWRDLLTAAHATGHEVLLRTAASEVWARASADGPPLAMAPETEALMDELMPTWRWTLV